MSDSIGIGGPRLIAIAAVGLMVVIFLISLPALVCRGPSIRYIVGRESDLSGDVLRVLQTSGHNDTWIILAEIEVNEIDYCRFVDQFGLQQCGSERAAAFISDPRWWQDLTFETAEVYCNTDPSNRLSVTKQGNRMYVNRAFHRPDTGN